VALTDAALRGSVPPECGHEMVQTEEQPRTSCRIQGYRDQAHIRRPFAELGREQPNEHSEARDGSPKILHQAMAMEAPCIVRYSKSEGRLTMSKVAGEKFAGLHKDLRGSFFDDN
jgi:hypothetical protein